MCKEQNKCNFIFQPLQDTQAALFDFVNFKLKLDLLFFFLLLRWLSLLWSSSKIVEFIFICSFSYLKEIKNLKKIKLWQSFCYIQIKSKFYLFFNFNVYIFVYACGVTVQKIEQFIHFLCDCGKHQRFIFLCSISTTIWF